ncbi:MAG: hypothetical protein NUV97_01845 [archaeon]|nr:hypothetical protein [archaeon]MCR4323696.1 hypothetical protein [Nanoarchaeota archaeon]
MVIRNKRGWMRILEATIAVLIVSGVLLVAHSKYVDRGLDAGTYAFNIQKKILNDISSRTDLRTYVLSSDTTIPTELSDFVSQQIPSSFSHSLKVCDLEIPPTPCKLNDTEFIATLNSDIFVEEVIISSNITDYNPKKVRLFLWENR